MSETFPQKHPKTTKKRQRLATFPKVIDLSATAQRLQFWLDHDWVLGLSLVLAVFLAYSPIWWAGFVWDDELNITDNSVLRDWQGLEQMWSISGTARMVGQYYPLTYLSFWLEYHLWQLNPLGYHLDNVLLHIGNALLLWLILRKLGVRGAWLAAALFALSPVQVESVAWMTERKNTLSCLFYLGSLLAALKFWKLEVANASAERDAVAVRQWNVYWLALGLYLTALLSKTSTVPLPMVIFLLLWWKRPKLTARDLSPLIPFFVAGFAMGLLTLWMERSQGGARGELLSWPERSIVVGKQFWFYLGKLVWPHPLIPVYPRWQIDPFNPLMYLPLLMALAAMVFLWCKRNTWWRPVFVATGYFVLLLLPITALFNQNYFRLSFVSDHFQYLASIGPLALAATGVVRVLETITPARKCLHSSLCAGLLFLLGAVSWRQAWVYESEETLWSYTLERNPNFSEGYINLGNTLVKEGKFDAAIAQFQKALNLNPNFASAYNDLGDALMQDGRLDEAIFALQTALKINPKLDLAYNNLGAAFVQKGRADEAIVQFQKALLIDPTSISVNNNLGDTLLRKGETDKAIAQFQKALKVYPNSADTRVKLGNAFLQKGQLLEAVAEFQKALEIDPKSEATYINLGNALIKNGRFDEAIVQYQKALLINPNLAEAHYDLGRVLMQEGKVEEAINEYNNALKINPNLAAAHSNLGSALFQEGRMDEAITQFQTTLAINPNIAETHANLGLALLKKGELVRAITQYQAALVLDPTSAATHYNLGLALLQKNQVADAIGQFQKALQLKPDFSEAKISLEKTQRLVRQPRP